MVGQTAIGHSVFCIDSTGTCWNVGFPAVVKYRYIETLVIGEDVMVEVDVELEPLPWVGRGHVGRHVERTGRLAWKRREVVV